MDAFALVFIPGCPLFLCMAQISWCFSWITIPDFLFGTAAVSLCQDLINSDVFEMPLSTKKELLHFLHLPFTISKGPKRNFLLRFTHFWHNFCNLLSSSLLSFSLFLGCLLWLHLVRKIIFSQHVKLRSSCEEKVQIDKRFLSSQAAWCKMFQAAQEGRNEAEI